MEMIVFRHNARARARLYIEGKFNATSSAAGIGERQRERKTDRVTYRRIYTRTAGIYYYIYTQSTACDTYIGARAALIPTS